MKSRSLSRSLVVASFGATLATAAGAADNELPDPQLKLAPDIESPVRRAPTASPGTPVAPAPKPGPPLLTPLPGVKRAATPQRGAEGPRTSEDDERGAIFLRADHIEGEANESVEASGKVELRSRRETVLSDWLHYDFIDDEIWGKGNVTLRRGIDTITGPELKFQRDAETGYFKSPQYYIGEIGAHGDASEIRFLGPNNFEASAASYTTCVAPNRDWYLIGDEIEVDKLRSVGTAHHAKVYFLDVPVIATPWLEFPLTNERKSGFLTPLAGSSQVRGFELATPYYFNLAPNYDATVTPRLMTKRGLMLEGEGRYLFEPALGRSSRKSCRGTTRPTRRAGRFRGSTTSSSRRGSTATSTTTAFPTRTTSPTSPTASRSRRRRRCRRKRASMPPTGRSARRCWCNRSRRCRIPPPS